MVSGSYQKENSSWFGLRGFLQVCFFQRLLESICSFEGRKKKKKKSIVSLQHQLLEFLMLIFPLQDILKVIFCYFLHLWCRNSFINVRMCYKHFASIHCHFSSLRGAVTYFQCSQNEQNQEVVPNMLLLDLASQSAFVSARCETCSLVQ